MLQLMPGDKYPVEEDFQNPAYQVLADAFIVIQKDKEVFIGHTPLI